MSKIKNSGLDQYCAEPSEQQQFGTAGVEGVNGGSHVMPTLDRFPVDISVLRLHVPTSCLSCTAFSNAITVHCSAPFPSQTYTHVKLMATVSYSGAQNSSKIMTVVNDAVGRL